MQRNVALSRRIVRTLAAGAAGVDARAALSAGARACHHHRPRAGPGGHAGRLDLILGHYLSGAAKRSFHPVLTLSIQERLHEAIPASARRR
jgi:hypothetical protein